LPYLVEEFNMGLTPSGLHHFIIDPFETFVFGLHLLVGIIDFITILHEEMHHLGDVLGLGTPVVPEVVFHDGGAFSGPRVITPDIDGTGVLIAVVLVIGDDTGVFGDLVVVFTVVISRDLSGPDGAAILGNTLHFIFQDHLGSLDIEATFVNDLKVTAVELYVVNKLVGTHGFTESIIHTYHIESIVGGVIVGVGGVIVIVIDGDGGYGGRGHDRFHVSVDTFKELYLLCNDRIQ
jgi:hypothetical protein